MEYGDGFFENIVESLSDVIVVTDEKGILTFISQEMEDIWGYKREEEIGQHVSKYYPAGMEEANEMMKALMEQGKLYNCETTFVKKDGTRADALLSVSLLKNKRGEVTGTLGIIRDVTEKKRLDDELREARDSLESIMEGITDPLVTTDERGIITYISQALTELVGYEKEDVIGKPIHICYPGGKEEGKKIMGLLGEKGIVRNYETQFTRKDGSLLPAMVSMSLLRDKGGEVIGTLGICKDITERKRLEDELRKTKTFLENILESSPNSIVVTDEKGVITYVNRCSEEVMGFSREERIGTHSSKYYASGPEVAKGLARLLKEKGQVQNYEAEFIKKAGGTVLASVSASLMRNADGKAIGTLGISKDITDLKRLENELLETKNYLENIIESTLDAIVITDNKGVITFINKGLEDMGGYKKEEEVGAHVSRYYAGGIKEAKKMMERLKDKGKIINYETVMKRRDGREFPAILSTSLLRDKDGKALGTLGVCKDITERVRMEEKLRVANEELIEKQRLLRERAADLETRNDYITELNHNLEIALTEVGEKNRELKETHSQLLQQEKMASIGQLAAGLAHEINNPIGFVNSNLGTMREYIEDVVSLIRKYEESRDLFEGSKDQKISSFYNEVEDLRKKIGIDFILADFEKVIWESLDGTDRVAKIVKNLKDFSHVDEAELKYANINKGLESTLNIVWNELKYKATVTKDYGDIPELNCYPQQLNQVFMNILVNAAQAIEEKGEINIKTYESNGNICVQISDTGQGISEENIPKLFDPFFTTKEVGKGTGLGLSIAYGIIKKHSGRIYVKSKVEEGSTFSIELPKEAKLK
ncbi:MAG: PAS domain S-box protein [Desulfobacterales bacterium]|nr:PAS domain S-box protein [Desulfobacterales bacterium]